MNKKSLLIAAVAILVIAIIGITYLLFTEKQANRGVGTGISVG